MNATTVEINSAKDVFHLAAAEHCLISIGCFKQIIGIAPPL
jgi:hypothetical protein